MRLTHCALLRRVAAYRIVRGFRSDSKAAYDLGIDAATIAVNHAPRRHDRLGPDASRGELTVRIKGLVPRRARG
jgi:hypothetical protein